MFRGLIITESLKELDDKPFQPYVVRKYPHLMDGKIKIEIQELNVPDDEILEVVNEASRRLLPKKFYAHFLNPPEMLIAYPKTIVRVHKDDTESVNYSKKIGCLFGISRRLMKYNEMFEKDHPNDL